MKYIIVILTTILFMNCNETIKNVESIEVYYIRDGVNYPIDINCEAIRDKGFDEIREELLINDPDFISKFKIQYRKLRPSNSNKTFNVKMQAITHFNDKSDTICIGTFNQISINGKNANDSKELMLLIKDKMGVTPN